MNTRNRSKSGLILAAAAMASLALTATSANAAIIVDSNFVSGTKTGTLVAIDVPFVGTGNPVNVSGGPDWSGTPTAGPADDGFTTRNNLIVASDTTEGRGASQWEPDGTPFGEAHSYRTSGSSATPSVSYNFNLADSGIDIPDDSIINAIYATWGTRNSDGATYSFTEGAASDSTVRQTGGAAPDSDLVLSWIDSVSMVRNGNFDLLFTGPITVVGGDGFELLVTDNIQNAAHIDAVVIDFTAPVPEPSAFVLGAIGLLCVGWYAWRRKRKAA